MIPEDIEDFPRDIPVAIKHMQGAFRIVHEKSQQNAFKSEVNSFTCREDAVEFAENNGCEVFD